MEQIHPLQSPDQQLASGFGWPQRAGKVRTIRLNVNVCSEVRILVAIGLVFLPWIAVVFYTAGWWAALNLLGYAILVFAIGYGIVSMVLPASARTQVILLAPALGILAVSALTAFWLRLGLALIWAPALWLALMAVGALSLWRDRASWTKSTVAYGLVLAIFSALICAVCFFPSASNDLVQAPRWKLQLEVRRTLNTFTLWLQALKLATARRKPPEQSLPTFFTTLDRMHRQLPFPVLTNSTWETL